MTEYIRVRQNETGHELTVRADRDMTGLTVIDKAALGSDGLPLPMKPKSTVAKRAAEKKAVATAKAADNGHEADAKKE